jgi:cellulose synthase/poly-beta-1,6-N-acetylglucosamine synthase-like glycosyltransferase
MTIAVYIFVIAVVLVLFVVFGYPLLLAAWPARHRNVEHGGSGTLRTVSVILPVRNGGAWLRTKLDSLLALNYPPELVQIIVVSDGSTDATDSIAAERADRVLLLQNPGIGKAAAINHAMAYATGEILFFTDVRQTLHPQALRMLVQRFDDPAVGVASGELMICSSRTHEEENVSLYWRYEKWIRARHSSIDSLLGATGAIYAMRRELAWPMPPGTLLDDVHLPLQAFFSGYRIVFVPGAHAYDSATALNTEFQRKVRTLAGVYQVVAAFPQLLGPGNRMWFHFVSHKIGRLLLPFLLVTVGLSSLFLPAPYWQTAVFGQAVFYFIALIDVWIPESNPIKRVSSVVRTFVVLICAALWAVSILFRSSDTLWKTPGPRNTTAQTSA